MILEKALTLQLAHFEDSEFYDKLTQARREASSRPLSLVNADVRSRAERDLPRRATPCCWSRFRRGPSLILIGAGLPSFLPRRSSPAMRSVCFAGARPTRACRSYLEIGARARGRRQGGQAVPARAAVCCSAIGIFSTSCSSRTVRLTLRRDTWGFVLGLVSTAAFYGAYAWIVLATIARRHHARRDDDVPAAVQARGSRRCRRA